MTRQTQNAEIQALYREVNERIRDVTSPPADTEFLCECAEATCTEAVAMTLQEYEAVRGNPRHFLVLPGHELDEVEDVVEQHDGFTVVRKKAGAAEVAVATDPRS